MPLDLTALTTLFSGGQLAVIVFVMLELRGLKERVKDLSAQNVEQDKHIAAIDKRLSNVLGRLQIPDAIDN